MPFRDIIGHARLVDLLARSVRRRALPPSLVFSGPAGVGKRLSATAVAQAVNCLAPVLRSGGLQPANLPLEGDRPAEAGRYSDLEIDACGVCVACTRIARRVHPDILIVEPGDNGSIKVDRIREVVDQVAYRPFEGKRRVVIVDEADTLAPAAQNALLKTLEEPPSASSFILITSRPDMLLPTVRSRCPELRFRALDSADIARALVARGHGEAMARAVAVTADGSLGRALEADEDELGEAREVAERVLVQVASEPSASRRLDAAKNLLTNTGRGGVTDREQLASHLRAMSSLIRDIELLTTRAEAQTLANPDNRPALERMTPAYGGERGLRAFAAVGRALGALDRNASVKIVADWLVLQL